MMSLHELQHSFIEAILDDDCATLDTEIVSNGMRPARRLQIYRNNARANFLSALRATFPVVARLSGDDWFEQTAHRYHAAHPSRSGDLQYVGKLFAEFLATQLQEGAYRYFSDVAQLEWAYQEVLTSAECSGGTLQQLNALSAYAQEHVIFRLHPAARWIRSEFPILPIWKANQPDAKQVAVNLDSGRSQVLLIRRDDHVELREIGVAEFALLQLFSSGLVLGRVAEQFSVELPTHDFGRTLMRLAELGVIDDFTLPPDLPGDVSR